MEEKVLENTNEIIEDGVEIYEFLPVEDEDNKSIAVVVAAGLAVVGGITILVRKNRQKIAAWETKREIERLRKKGYVVYNPDACEVCEDTDSEKSE